MIEWEHNIPCNFCESTHSHFYAFIKRKSMNLVQCDECNLVWIDPRQKFKHHVEAKGNIENATNSFWKKWNRPNVRRFHRNVIHNSMRKMESPRTLFDVGFGAGTTLVEGRELGLKCSGNEINVASISEMKMLGFEVFRSKTVDLKLDKKFDIILCLDNIEHTSTPKEDLEWIYSHHNDDGILYLTTLYLGCPRHLKDAECWNLFGTSHNYYFYPRTLIEMIESTGYEILLERKGEAVITLISRKVR